MVLQVGDLAPDVRLKDLEDQEISLADYWKSGQNVLLVFLPHLG
jgi:peroxiredoxin